MKKKRIAFAWFDLGKLLQDPAYSVQLVSKLNFFDPTELFTILKDCTDVLCEERADNKDYSNTRKRHITPDDLIVLPSFSKRIKQLCQDNSIEWCVKHYGFDAPSGKFPFEIDRLDMLALHVLNSLDEAYAIAESNSSSLQCSLKLAHVIYCWDSLQEKILGVEKSRLMVDGLLRLYKTSKENNQLEAGLTRAALNKTAAARRDLLIANLLLILVYTGDDKDKTWHSLHDFANYWLELLDGLIKEEYPIFASMLVGHADVNRDAVLFTLEKLQKIVQEINHFDKELVGKLIAKPIPEIDSKFEHWGSAMLDLKLDWVLPAEGGWYPRIVDLTDYVVV